MPLPPSHCRPCILTVATAMLNTDDPDDNAGVIFKRLCPTKEDMPGQPVQVWECSTPADEAQRIAEVRQAGHGAAGILQAWVVAGQWQGRAGSMMQARAPVPAVPYRFQGINIPGFISGAARLAAACVQEAVRLHKECGVEYADMTVLLRAFK